MGQVRYDDEAHSSNPFMNPYRLVDTSYHVVRYNILLHITYETIEIRPRFPDPFLLSQGLVTKT